MRAAVHAVLGLCMLAGSAWAQAADPGPYRVQVTNVDSSDFPLVKVEFQVFNRTLNTPPWDPSQQAQILEQVLGDEKSAEITQPASVCHEADVVMAIAIDISGSVQDVLDGIKTGVKDLFGSLGPNDVAGVYAFDSGNKHRYPVEGATPIYTRDSGPLQAKLDEIQGGGSSPIWEGMDAELGRLLQYTHPATRPKPTRVLVSLTDGQNNREPEKGRDLLEKAQKGGGLLVNLGYGNTNPPVLTAIAEASGGVYVDKVEGNVGDILKKTLKSVRTTYCLEYKSPHPSEVNEPAGVTVIAGGSRGTTRYPLPFVIPEDSRGVKLFMPVDVITYMSLYATGSLPKIEASITLMDPQGNPWTKTGSVDREPKGTTITLDASAWNEPDGLDPLALPKLEDLDPNGNWGFMIPVPDAYLKIPTDYTDLSGDPNEPVIKDVDHFLVKANFVMEGFAAGAGKQYPSSTRLSVQDRTSPHVFLRFQPADGGVASQLRILEDEVDQDPAILAKSPTDPAVTVPDGASVRQLGNGAKRAELRYRWRADDGSEAAGKAPDQVWAEWDANTGAASFAMDGGDSTVFGRGMVIEASTRLSIEVLARDNFTLVEESTSPEEQGAFTETAPDPDQGPLHSQFDPNRTQAQRPYAAPFLPIVARTELEDDRKKPGVAWWLESPGDDRDRQAGKEALSEVVFPVADEDLLRKRAAAGLPDVDGALRKLVIRAQDGQGNVTLVEVPITVTGGGIGARQMEIESRRGELR